jgi:L-alanine-DL-glutamate epimerase-like enolase superfamily enzyme
MDPTETTVVYRAMDRALKGHPYAKSAIDMACWDLLGKASNQPICNLLGGRFGDDHVLYRAISQRAPEEMAENVAKYRAEGYRRFQLKVGGNPDIDIARIKAVAALMQDGDVLVADANTGWLMHDAMRVVRGVHDVDVYIEQPCDAYEENLSVRRRCTHPFVLDESIYNIPELIRAVSDQAMDVINVKISKLGGITKAREVRDLCVAMGIAMTVEDTWGSDIITAGISHLAHSTPTELLFTSTDFNSYVTVSTADGAPARVNGRMAAPTNPGLGIEPKMDVLGKPVLVVDEARANER